MPRRGAPGVARIGDNLDTNLTLRSRAQREGWPTERALRTGLLHDFVRGPSFETAASRPPQDEVVDWMMRLLTEISC